MTEKQLSIVFTEAELTLGTRSPELNSVRMPSADSGEAVVAEVLLEHVGAAFRQHQPTEEVLFRNAIRDLFYRGCYYKPTIHEGPFPTPRMPVKALGTRPDDFLKQILNLPPRENLTFLVGNRGSGKTALVNYLITVPLQRLCLRRRKKGKELLFARVNVEGTMHRTDGSLGRLLRQVAEKLVYAIGHAYHLARPSKDAARSDCLRLATELLRVAAPDHNELFHLTSFQDALRELSTQFQILFIFDNWDGAFHALNDQALVALADAGASGAAEPPADSTPYLGLQELLQFLRQPWSTGIGLRSIVVTRPDSLRIIEELEKRALPSSAPPRYKCFWIESVPLLEAISGRVKLSEAVVKSKAIRAKWRTLDKRVGGESFVKASRILNLLKNSLAAEINVKPYEAYRATRGDVRLGDLLSNIGNESLREVLELFESLSWSFAHRGGDLLAERITQQPWLILRAFLVDGHRRFSEFFCATRNIYSGLSARARFKPTGEMRNVTFFWPEYLLLRTVLAFARSSSAGAVNGPRPQGFTYDGGPSLTHVLDRLSSGARKYPRSVFHSAIRMLNDGSNLAAVWARRGVNPGRQLTIDRLDPSPAGEILCESLYFRAMYFELTVEDHEVKLPPVFLNALARYEASLRPEVLDLSYLTIAKSAGYDELAEAALGLRAHRARCFAEWTYSALDLERGMFPESFKAVEEICGPLPTADALRESLEQELEVIVRQRQGAERAKEVSGPLDDYLREGIRQAQCRNYFGSAQFPIEPQQIARYMLSLEWN